MTEPSKHHLIPQCKNCKWFKVETYEDYGGIYVCLNPNPKLFKTDIAQPEGYCVYFEPIKPQVKGEI